VLPKQQQSMHWGLARKGHKVLLIDLDPQGNLSMSLGIPFPDEETNSIAQLMFDKLQSRGADTVPALLEQIKTIYHQPLYADIFDS
jgi:cellulose biosynthesis protein BcsQ